MEMFSWKTPLPWQWWGWTVTTKRRCQICSSKSLYLRIQY